MATRTKTVIGLGDSVAAGCGAKQKNGWMQRARSRYYELNDDSIGMGQSWFYDLTVPGETVESLSAAVARSEIFRRDRDQHATLTVVSIGGHQLAEDIRQHGRPMPEYFWARIGALFSNLWGHGDVLYVGIPAPDIGRMKILGKASLEAFSERDIEQAIREYEEAATEAAVTGAPDCSVATAVPVFDFTLSHAEYGTVADAVHPHDRGHELVFEYVEPAFETMIGVR
jgi:hypothetical protein